MGKVEKLVVLSVLLLIVGILAVSLTMDDPLRKDDVALAGAPTPAAQAGAPIGAPPGAPPGAPIGATGAEAAPSALLSANFGAPAAETAFSIPAGSILKTADGLQESFMPDMKFYTWKAGDTFPVISQRFYGDLTRLATLRRVNEGRFDVQPGERILIPIYDSDGAAPAATTTAPAPAVSQPSPAASAPGPVAEKPASSGPRIHVVKPGESLWKISKQELGAGSRWKEIYEANRDVLASPEALHAGLKLRIP